MARTDLHSVDGYIRSQPEATQVILQLVRSTLREVMLEALPEAEEVISYQIPALRVRGAGALYFAGYKNHYAIYPASEGMIASLGAELAPCLAGKATIRFSLSEPVPVDLLRRIAQYRAAELAGHAKTKPAGRRRGRSADLSS